MTDILTKRRLIRLVKIHRAQGLTREEERELRRILCRDNPYAHDLDREELIDLSLVVIGAGVMMEWVDSLPA